MKEENHNSQQFVEIFHLLKKNSLDSILINGLKSKNQLVKEGKTFEPIRDGVFEDHYDTIFFQWYTDGLKPALFFESTDWISIEVDPEKTFVYNRELRPHFLAGLPELNESDNYDSTAKLKEIEKNYEASKLLLSDFITYSNQFIKMQSSIDNTKTIIRDPFSSKPLIVDINDERQWYPKFSYFNEILIKTSIPPIKFKRYNHAE